MDADLVELVSVFGWSGAHAGGLAAHDGVRVVARGRLAAVVADGKERLIGGHDGDVTAIACSGSLIATGQEACAESPVSTLG